MVQACGRWSSIKMQSKFGYQSPNQIWFRHSHGRGRGTGKVAACLGPRTAHPPPTLTGHYPLTPDSAQKQLLSEYKLGGSARRPGLGAGLTPGPGQAASPRMRRALG